MLGKEQHVTGSSGSPYTEACLCLTANSHEERSQAWGWVAPWLLGHLGAPPGFNKVLVSLRSELGSAHQNAVFSEDRSTASCQLC